VRIIHHKQVADMERDNADVTHTIPVYTGYFCSLGDDSFCDMIAAKSHRTLSTEWFIVEGTYHLQVRMNLEGEFTSKRREYGVGKGGVAECVCEAFHETRYK